MVDTIFIEGYIRDMENTIRFHIEMTEEEAERLDDLVGYYARKFGVRVSRAAAIKLAVKLAASKENIYRGA